MELLFLLSITFFSVDADTKNPLAKKIMGVIGPGNYIRYCNFEDKNGCKNECDRLGSLAIREHLPDVKKSIKELLDDKFPGPITMEKCTALCMATTEKFIIALFIESDDNLEEEKIVCTALCGTQLSYSNAALHEQAVDEAIGQIFIDATPEFFELI